jgi:uncharacterized BrkB/YihY/UPF0761 family membrane protein
MLHRIQKFFSPSPPSSLPSVIPRESAEESYLAGLFRVFFFAGVVPLFTLLTGIMFWSLTSMYSPHKSDDVFRWIWFFLVFLRCGLFFLGSLMVIYGFLTCHRHGWRFIVLGSFLLQPEYILNYDLLR